MSINAVTGAFGFTGRHITLCLLSKDKRIITLTNHPNPNDELFGKIEVAPLDFGDEARLQSSLKGISVLYNTYWIRFPRGPLTFETAVRNTIVLLNAAKHAGIQKIVHISISNPSLESNLPYFRGKALVEQAIVESGISYAILRPTVIFGEKGLLINNIAWLVRRFPFFAIPGSGSYRLQPVYVGDVAKMAVELAEVEENIVRDVAGTEVYAFAELVRLVRDMVGSRCLLVSTPPKLTYLLSKLIGSTLGDALITWDEVKGLMDELLVSNQSPLGTTALSEWIASNAEWLGKRYMGEIQTHYR